MFSDFIAISSISKLQPCNTIEKYFGNCFARIINDVNTAFTTHPLRMDNLLVILSYFCL